MIILFTNPCFFYPRILLISPQLSGNDTKQLLTRFSCEDEETKDYNWNSTENNCNILELSEYDYIFKDGENSTKVITIKTLKQGKTQLVAHAKWISNTSNLTVE